MPQDFSRTLSLMRKERKISQRAAAQALKVSQALLSHYENGLREPGLDFVVRAADYYDVSTDFLLGRTLVRDGAVIQAETLPDALEEKGNRLGRASISSMLGKKLVINSTALIFDLLRASGRRALIKEASNFFSIAVYKVYRYVYHAGADNPDSVFNIPYDVFPYASDMEMKACELRLAAASKAGKGAAAQPPLVIRQDDLPEQYPAYCQSLLSILHTVGDSIEGRMEK